uniref:NAD-dependent DNA ligase N-terminal domain-containing protein n=1 Tax=uncultured prokaryote TaxID=198431 RepID=A0A0H5Q435_9ZZZZ|nr:hypothetical protein [uncultured prokaryote]
MEDKKSLMKEKIEILNRASKAYYQDAEEMMSNFEYDKLYDELVALEAETGMILAGSPTQHVGYEVLSDLPKERHPERMLSLDKTKDRQALAEWLGTQKGLLSWKLDGLTIVLTYEDGKLAKALTRGNGDVGEVITSNARVFANVPVEIPYKGRLVLRGEAVIRYSDFEKINAAIGDADAKYKNPRNLCSGSVRQLNNRITAERRLCYVGMTRAKETLILTSAAMRTLYGRTDYTRESQFLREVDKRLLEGDAIFERRPRDTGLGVSTGSIDGYAAKESPKPYDALRYAKAATRANVSAAAGGEDFAIGDRVRHAKFGEGLIIDQDDKTMTVIFDAAGQKKMAKGIAPLKKI